MQANAIVIFDLETSSKDVGAAQILEVACVVVDFTRLEVVDGSEFVTLVRPEDESKLEPGAMAANKIPLDDLRKAPPAAAAWPRFVDHVKRYALKGGTFAAPYPGGFNVRAFDLPIVDRYCRRFGPKTQDGTPSLFNRVRQFDAIDDAQRWFGQTNVSDGISLDAIRELLGMSSENAHRALTDVRQTAWLLCKFQKLYREFAPRVKFKDAAKGVLF